MRRVLIPGFFLVLTALPVVAQLQIFMQPAQQLGQAAPAGIGAVLVTRNGAPVINEVLPRSPADGAGLKAQDTIVWVNYRDVAGMKLDEIVGLIRGPVGSHVAITVLHPGDPAPHTYTMLRRPILIGQ